MKLLLSLCCALLVISTHAQNTFPSTGNAGIGITSSLTHPLTIKPGSDGVGLLLKPPSSNTNTGIFLQLATHPYFNHIYEIKANKRLDLIGGEQLFLFGNDIFFQGNAVVTRSNTADPTSLSASISSGTMPFEINTYTSSTGHGQIRYAGIQNIASLTKEAYHRIAFKVKALQSNLSDGTEVLSIHSNGTVGINTTDTAGNYKLAVNGAAIFTRVVVKNYSTPWADYVFDESYKLPTLQDIEAYIKKHKHLPEMPTTEEVEKDGIDISNTQVVLLKNLEQLTLHVIEQNKKIEVQQKQIDRQQKQLEFLLAKDGNNKAAN